MGGICAFIDAEHAMDPVYAKRIGVDVDELLVSQPDHGEQALEIADLLIRSGAVDVVAIDSVAALTPKAELEGAMGDQTVGLQARMMSQAMRKLAGNLNRANTLCVFTNQIREKVGVMFGSPETQPGGRALKFYASQRLDIRRIETLKEGTEAVGNRVRVKVVKNKVAAPFRQAEFDIEYGQGICAEGCILDLGIEHNIVQKSGSFFSYGDERLGQGRNNVKGYLRENPRDRAGDRAEDLRALGAAPASPLGRDRVAAAGRRGGRPSRDAEAPAGPDARRSRPPSREKAPSPSGRSTWPTGRSPAASAPSRSCATLLERKRVEPGGDRRRRRGAAGDRPPRRCPLRAPLRRGQARARPAGARTGSRGPAPARDRARADRRRARRRTTATPSCDRAAAARAGATPRRPRRPRARQAWRLLVRRGYAPELAYEASGTRERTERERRRAA